MKMAVMADRATEIRGIDRIAIRDLVQMIKTPLVNKTTPQARQPLTSAKVQRRSTMDNTRQAHQQLSQNEKSTYVTGTTISASKSISLNSRFAEDWDLAPTDLWTKFPVRPLPELLQGNLYFAIVEDHQLLPLYFTFKMSFQY